MVQWGRGGACARVLCVDAPTSACSDRSSAENSSAALVKVSAEAQCPLGPTRCGAKRLVPYLGRPWLHPEGDGAGTALNGSRTEGHVV